MLTYFCSHVKYSYCMIHSRRNFFRKMCFKATVQCLKTRVLGYLNILLTNWAAVRIIVTCSNFVSQLSFNNCQCEVQINTREVGCLNIYHQLYCLKMSIILAAISCPT